MVPTRYGSSAMHSSTRPQRGSRMTSSTGDRPWWMPSARMDGADRRAHLARRAPGRTRRPRPAAWGTSPPSTPTSPVRHSSCTSAGMPSRVSRTRSALQVPEPRGPLDRRPPGGCRNAGEVTEPVPRRLVERRLAAELALERRDDLAVAPSPRTRRSGRASPRASSGRAARSRGRRCRTCQGLKIRHGSVSFVVDVWVLTDQPLTAPWRPLTIRFCMARKNTSAGIMASEVNAKTPAVSEEYCRRSRRRPAAACSSRR